MSEQTLSLVPCKTERLSGREAAVLFPSLAAGLWYGESVLNFLVTMFGEVFLGLFFLLYARRKAGKTV